MGVDDGAGGQRETPGRGHSCVLQSLEGYEGAGLHRAEVSAPGKQSHIEARSGVFVP
jgi:hypothetical protein